MIYDKARGEMTPRDVTNLEEILNKDNNSLLPAERDLLTARRDYLTDEELAKFGIEGAESTDGDKYANMGYNDLKKEAKERGITFPKETKKEGLVELLNEYDNLKDGDEFQGQIAHIATQEMIDENDLADQVEIGQLFFTEKEESTDGGK